MRKMRCVDFAVLWCCSCPISGVRLQQLVQRVSTASLGLFSSLLKSKVASAFPIHHLVIDLSSPVDSGSFFIVVRALVCAFIWLTVDSGDPFASHNHVSLVLEGGKRGPDPGLGRGGVALVSWSLEPSQLVFGLEVRPVWCTSSLAAVASSLFGWEAVSNAVWRCVQTEPWWRLQGFMLATPKTTRELPASEATRRTSHSQDPGNQF
ncbi:hypothetical protein F2Q69_00053984 [Brassica cretica]|uniref:Secreted protein n=1 Tax=Brassica cretica TaxID=69181 RepID=A0A8S9MYS1_BRACR|nr:hypothetical protein F2Q69_00053984 [Brassica cretica]